MNPIDLPLLEKQISALSNLLNDANVRNTAGEEIEGLLNFLGDLADDLKDNGNTTLFAQL